MSSLDHLIRPLEQVLNAVLLRYPERTALGISLGSTLAALSVIFKPALKTTGAASLVDLPLWAWLSLAVIFMHLPAIVSMFRRPSSAAQVLDAFSETIERSNFSEAEIRSQYRKLIDRMLDTPNGELHRHGAAANHTRRTANS